VSRSPRHRKCLGSGRRSRCSPRGRWRRPCRVGLTGLVVATGNLAARHQSREQPRRAERCHIHPRGGGRRVPMNNHRGSLRVRVPSAPGTIARMYGSYILRRAALTFFSFLDGGGGPCSSCAP
jgi:hypothetical protein